MVWFGKYNGSLQFPRGYRYHVEGGGPEDRSEQRSNGHTSHSIGDNVAALSTPAKNSVVSDAVAGL